MRWQTSRSFTWVNYLRVFRGGTGILEPPAQAHSPLLSFFSFSSKPMDAFAEIPFCFERQRPHSLLINGT